jgi:hypothetical protein
MLRFATRVSRPPFHRLTGAWEFFYRVLESLPEGLHDRLLEAPDPTYSAIENASRSWYEEVSMTRALSHLCKRLPEFAVNTLVMAPRALIEAVSLLGTLAEPQMVAVIRNFERSRLMTPGTGELEDGHFLALLLDCGELPHPGLREFRKYVWRSDVPNAARLRNFARALRADLCRLRLQWLETLVHRTLDPGFAVEHWRPEVIHALQLRVRSQRNRRALTRFLRAWGAGNRDYLMDHPESRRWRERFQNIDVDLWMRGIELSAQLADGVVLHLQVESNPWEVLKLGTYMDTCLGVNGCNAFSAAAVLLDVNKQVVYARNECGGVVARQLLAISNAGELVAFSVYSTSKAKDISDLFLQYDRRFAEALAIPLFRPLEGHEYEIPLIIANDWYDDGPWQKLAETIEA